MVEKNLEVRRGLLTNLESLAGDIVNLHVDKGDAKYVLAAIDVITEQQVEIRDLQSELANYRGTVQSLFDVSRRLAEMAGAV